jgi:hypothetical protein
MEIINSRSCIICFEDIDSIKKDKFLFSCKCKIIYHYECLEKWLTQSPTCPICRKYVKKKEQLLYKNYIYIICYILSVIITILIFFKVI